MHNSKFGLIGNPIRHSFSKKYFEDKFAKLGLDDFSYELFELKSIKELPNLIATEKDLQGFNVTSPFKMQILSYLNFLCDEAETIGSVNTVRIENNQLIGYNTDWIGFLDSLRQQTDISKIHSALILGTGGAAKSVAYALKLQNIKILFASTKVNAKLDQSISYSELNDFDNFDMFDIIINATPCGMATYPQVAPINTNKISSNHVVFDLIYNPHQTMLLNIAKNKGCKTINGLQMLYNQAEESWKIWNK